MDSQKRVNGGLWLTLLGCVFLVWSFGFVGNDGYKERDYLPLPVPEKSQIARQCQKYYKNYGYTLIKG